MTTAVVILAVANLLLALCCEGQRRERKSWAHERTQLVNRAIARHAGEAIALDRADAPRLEREVKHPVLVEGIS